MSLRTLQIDGRAVEQLLAVGTDDVELRKVHVAVDETGHDQLAPQILDSRMRRQGPEQAPGIAGLDDAATVEQQQAVVEVFPGVVASGLAGIREAMQDTSAYRLHGAYTASSMTTSSSSCCSQFGRPPA